VVGITQDWLPLIEEINPSFFEITVALAFHFFSIENVDIAVIEVGMGGRLDSTNIITPLVSLITNIGLDHQKFLGNTKPEIAVEKAGIIKTGIPIVVSEKQSETASIFSDTAKNKTSTLRFGTDNISIEDLGIEKGIRHVLANYQADQKKEKLELSLLGKYQLKNLAGILTSLDFIRDAGFDISEKAVFNGLKNVQKNTGLMGRWQILKEKPLLICDTGHNEDGLKEVFEQLKSYSCKNLWLIWGMVNDKDHSAILKLIPREAKLIATQPSLPRALSSSQMADLLKKEGLSCIEIQTVPKALDYVLKNADFKDLIFIGGSTFTVAEIPFEDFSEAD